MTYKHLGWLLSGSLLLSLAGCDVSIGKCKEDDAGDCDFGFDEDEDIDSGKSDGGDGDGEGDGSVEGDAGLDAGDDTDAGGDGDGDGDGPVYEGEPLELEELCEAFVSRRAAWESLLDDCECSFEDSNELRSQLGMFGSDDRGFGCTTAYEKTLTSEHVTYRAAAAGACADAFLKYLEAAPKSCPEIGFVASYFAAHAGKGIAHPAQLAACQATFEGDLNENALCENDWECKGDLRCRLPGEGAAERKCLRPVPLRGLCTRDQDCTSGSLCIRENAEGSTSSCVSERDLKISGGHCSRHPECADGYVCDNDPDNDPEYKCVAEQESLPICAQ